MPTTNHIIRKKPIFNMLPNICPPSGLEPLAMALSITIITIASTSSNISTLITMPAKRCWRNPISSNALYMMVVDDIASIPLRKMQSIRLHPKACPTNTPSTIIENIMVMAAITGAMPILIIFLNEKSSPKENNKNITPISAQVWMSALSTTDMV